MQWVYVLVSLFFLQKLIWFSNEFRATANSILVFGPEI
jgi:hypothetical protein